MQRVVDTAVWVCRHVESASDMPPGVQPKLAVAGGRGIACLAPACILELHDRTYTTQLRSCVFCHHRLPSYDRVMFTDAAANLTLTAPVCYPCASPGGPLADWAGLPDHAP